MPFLLPASPASRLHLSLLFKVSGYFLLAAVILIIAVYQEEDWRGARVWEAAQRDLRARGETLDWQAFIAAPIPEDQNLAFAPFFVRQLRYQPDPRTHAPTLVPVKSLYDSSPAAQWIFAPRGLAPAGWCWAHATDFAGFARGCLAQAGAPHPGLTSAPVDIILATIHAQFGTDLDELASAAATRPFTRFPVSWNLDNPGDIALPQYGTLYETCQILSLRASAEIAAGQHGDALRDLELCLRLSASLRQDPVLSAHLTDMNCLFRVLTSAWEGLADRCWSTDELARLQAGLAQCDLLRAELMMCRGKRASELKIAGYLKRKRDLSTLRMVLTGLDPTAPALPELLRFIYDWMPVGWFDLNKAYGARWLQTITIDPIDTSAHRYHVEQMQVAMQTQQRVPARASNLLPIVGVPVKDSTVRRVLWTQTGLDEAIVACALERFRIEHGGYPASLAELAPAYLAAVPTDVLGTEPLHYRQTTDGRYLLYTAGWNRADEGGLVVWDDAHHPDITRGDWVWQYTLSATQKAASSP